MPLHSIPLGHVIVKAMEGVKKLKFVTELKDGHRNVISFISFVNPA
jgi:hypothetical protein